MGSDPGFPDLVLPVPPVLHLAELKTVDGALSPEQERWLEAIRSCRAVEAHVWRPGDTARIQEVLIGGARAEL